ncbi:unnamed protein product [Cylindrotheca closterium]|uniref:Phosphoglycolate phosphatase n=1 Tax=Cylindrotheca closterium TaxID=2856 RepID=A0AAD2JJX5_9STRA|nr:unnamed protein product [Cylindrotheca closterium]
MTVTTSNSITTSAANKRLPVLRGVVFDMDGTLTIPNLDFVEMYRRCGVDQSKDILEEIASRSKEDQQIAFAAIDELEEEGRRTLQLMPGAAELTCWLAHHQIPMALVTRNTRKSAKVLTDRVLPPNVNLDVAITRDDEQGYAPKPSPEAMQAIAKQWSMELPNDGIFMVGDSVENDIVFGKNAGVATALLDTEKIHSESGADFVMSELTDLARHLWTNYDIESPLGTAARTLEKYPRPEPSTDLTKAAANGDMDTIRELAKSDGFDINAVDESKNTALIWATENNQSEVVEWILSTFADVVAKDHKGYLGATAITRASRLGHCYILKALIKAGADMDTPNDKLQYPLHFAAFKEKKDAVTILLESGANPRSLDRKGRTPAQDTKNETIRDMILACAAKNGSS